MTTLKTISVERLAELSRQEPVDLIDVRTPAEYRELHVSIARNQPLESLDPQALLQNREGSEEKALYVMCRTGNRARQACQKIAEAGLTQVVTVEGGAEACQAAGLAVVRGKKTISLERQVRIAAGFLVLVGSVLGFFNPYFIAIPAFVGAGLIFAGITDTCGMAMVLARMPWNQVRSCSMPTGHQQNA